MNVIISAGHTLPAEFGPEPTEGSYKSHASVHFKLFRLEGQLSLQINECLGAIQYNTMGYPTNQLEVAITTDLQHRSFYIYKILITTKWRTIILPLKLFNAMVFMFYFVIKMDFKSSSQLSYWTSLNLLFLRGSMFCFVLVTANLLRILHFWPISPFFQQILLLFCFSLALNLLTRHYGGNDRFCARLKVPPFSLKYEWQFWSKFYRLQIFFSRLAISLNFVLVPPWVIANIFYY
jgi:hypothetical protein